MGLFNTREEAEQFSKFEERHPNQKEIKRLRKEMKKLEKQVSEAERRILADFRREQTRKMKIKRQPIHTPKPLRPQV